MNTEENDIIKILITKHLTGEASVEEENQLNEWKALDSANQDLLDRYKKVYDLVQEQGTSQEFEINLDKEWERFLTETQEETPTIPIDANSSSQKPWLRIAAVISFLIISAFAANYFLDKNDPIVYQTAENTLTIKLPDGSIVDLNQNSKLVYDQYFGKSNRTISLSGEGFFEVQSDKFNPFTIEINQIKIEVVGTKFNVSGYGASETIEVIVEEGLVNFSADKSTVELSAGEKGVYTKSLQQLRETPNDDINFISWKTKKIVFTNSKLPEVVETLNKVYGDRIIITSDISDSCEVTVTFNQQNLEAVLNVLKTTLNLTFRNIDNRIEIVDAECE